MKNPLRFLKTGAKTVQNTFLMLMVRHTLTGIAGGFVAAGYLTDGEVEIAVGAIVALLGVALSFWDKRQRAAA